MYIAQKYIGNDYTPGEVLPDDLPREFIERLLNAGAIRKTAPDPVIPDAEEPLPPDEEETQAADMPRDEVHPEPESESDEDEIAEEDEVAPEIDAMDGIVQNDAEPKDAPGKKTAAKKPAAKKTTGGRKAK